jgi:hypothetical protein
MAAACRGPLVGAGLLLSARARPSSCWAPPCRPSGPGARRVFQVPARVWRRAARDGVDDAPPARWMVAHQRWAGRPGAHRLQALAPLGQLQWGECAQLGRCDEELYKVHEVGGGAWGADWFVLLWRGGEGAGGCTRHRWRSGQQCRRRCCCTLRPWRLHAGPLPAAWPGWELGGDVAAPPSSPGWGCHCLLPPALDVQRHNVGELGGCSPEHVNGSRSEGRTQHARQPSRSRPATCRPGRTSDIPRIVWHPRCCARSPRPAGPPAAPPPTAPCTRWVALAAALAARRVAARARPQLLGAPLPRSRLRQF